MNPPDSHVLNQGNQLNTRGNALAFHANRNRKDASTVRWNWLNPRSALAEIGACGGSQGLQKVDGKSHGEVAPHCGPWGSTVGGTLNDLTGWKNRHFQNKAVMSENDVWTPCVLCRGRSGKVGVQTRDNPEHAQTNKGVLLSP